MTARKPVRGRASAFLLSGGTKEKSTREAAMTLHAVTPAGYRILREDDLRAYLAEIPAVTARLGGAPAGWSISEVGDGNLNLVFIVKGSSGGLAVKQALPYV